MGLRIFETDPDAAPKPRQRFADDLVGRFRSGYQINGRPASLQKWRVTSGDPEVATAISDLLRGEKPQEWQTQGEDNLEVFTAAEKVKVIIEGPSALRSEMVLWGRAGAIRRCDGVEQTADDAKGRPCECPAGYTDRKEAAKKGTGCQPNVTLFFRLAEDPDMGRFKFTSGSWSLVRDLADVELKLAAIDGPALAWLKLEVVEYDSGGTRRSFTKPVIDVIGPDKSGRYDEPPF
ncbi:hypothetical protein Acy02nite_68600 [Actinoplanes cyaneus]|uniref:Uncharacterized protein n=1 Tax=Actinoplanes cyaneus TaxID=52696 RepID=A0A919INN5_9ACTN|nr:hypothetical protein [Actinoplanes cyaneus]MCW2139091.1 hypothetical protein [Actinoplanes cyaneus]GID68979.1 hypothetical protein Acy02nite_68600 [Actinoplanes cyaneus]